MFICEHSHTHTDMCVVVRVVCASAIDIDVADGLMKCAMKYAVVREICCSTEILIND